MKRVGGLFESIGLWANLGSALCAAARGKRDRPEVAAFLRDAEDHLNRIGEELRSGRYRFSPYRAFEVSDTKRRLIHAPTFPDRVVHHAMIRVVGPVLEAGASEHSYACRRGYGQHRALARAAEWTRRGRWYGKMDVRKFYDSVDQGILMERLAGRFREARLLELFRGLLDSYSTAPGRGLPIGALTSQYLGNFLLDAFDRDLARTGRADHFLRYLDDTVVWTRRQEDLGAVRDAAVSSLAALGLELKHGGEWNRCDQGVPLLGFVVYPGRIRLGRAGRRRLRSKFVRLAKRVRQGTISDLEAQSRATALFAHATTADDRGWRRTVLGIHDFGEELGPRSRDARRCLEQHRGELPLGVPQQERAGQSQQECWFPPGSGPRIGDADRSPDDAPSRAWPLSSDLAESAGKSPPRSETRRGAVRKARGGAPGPATAPPTETP